MNNLVRVRFAPSPTGFLHVGGLRTALYNFLFARHHEGTFVLRIEDTDRTRRVEGAVENLIATLQWAGIDFDEGPGREGEFGPYIQSDRLAVYQDHAQQLIDAGKAYYCFCTPERLDEVRKKQIAKKLTPAYDGQCRTIPPPEAARRRQEGEISVVRLKVPKEGAMTFQDLIRGDVTISLSVLDDQVLLKSDGFPTYHLAVVVDDHLMKISHVIRGEEWLSSTPKHILLYQSFGWPLPAYAHLPLLLNPDRTKLSKRQGDVAVEEYRTKGYLREALINFVAFLGWNPGDEREIFSLDELIREFSLERVGKSGAIFNLEKLNWMNARHLRMKPDAEILSLIRGYLKTHSQWSGGSVEDRYLTQVIGVMRERATFVADFVEKCPYFYRPPADYDPDVRKKRWKEDSADLLKQYIDAVSGLRNPGREAYETALRQTAERAGKKVGDLIHPVRLAVSGMGSGPGLYEILDILGKDESIRRMTTAVERLS